MCVEGFFTIIMNPILKANNVFFRYDSQPKYILQDLSFTVEKGEYVSIVGENGCGKSTLVRLLLKLLKPTSGTIEKKVKAIGYVPQKKINIHHFPITVRELLNSYKCILKVRDGTSINEMLERIGLSGYEKKLVGQLSGGQLQKLYIARSLIGSPDLLILDEPSTGIDVKGQKDIYAILKHLNKEKGLTIISVDHNLNAAVLNSTTIFHIKDGNGHFCNPQKYAKEAISTDFLNL